MDMVEKVRAALFAELQKGSSYGGGHGTIYVSDISADGDDEVVVDGILDLTALARAAIAAMREPTEKMVEAGENEFRLLRVDSFERDVWDAMIDAALTSSEPATQSSE